jgi:hypothetical protein
MARDCHRSQTRPLAQMDLFYNVDLIRLHFLSSALQVVYVPFQPI